MSGTHCAHVSPRSVVANRRRIMLPWTTPARRGGRGDAHRTVLLSFFAVNQQFIRVFIISLVVSYEFRSVRASEGRWRGEKRRKKSREEIKTIVYHSKKRQERPKDHYGTTCFSDSNRKKTRYKKTKTKRSLLRRHRRRRIDVSTTPTDTRVHAAVLR